MRKNKGRLTYYLEMIDEKYHFEKNQQLFKGVHRRKTKTTKRTLSELVFNENEVGAIDFTKNGLRPVDKNILLTMMKEYKESET